MRITEEKQGVSTSGKGIPVEGGILMTAIPKPKRLLFDICTMIEMAFSFRRCFGERRGSVTRIEYSMMLCVRRMTAEHISISFSKSIIMAKTRAGKNRSGMPRTDLLEQERR